MKTIFKNISIIISLLLLSTHSFAQFGCKYVFDFNPASTETIVVASEVNIDTLEKVFKDSWKINPYKIVKKEEVLKNIQQYKDNAKYAFITIQVNKLGRDIYFSTKINNKAKEVPTSIVAFESTEQVNDMYSLAAELKKDIIVIQQFATISKDDQHKLMDPDPSIKDKTLIIAKSAFTNKGIEHVQKNYPYKVKFLSKEEVSKEIMNPSPNTVLYEISGFGTPYATAIDLNTNKMVFMIDAKAPSGTYNHYNIDMLERRLKKD